MYTAKDNVSTMSRANNSKYVHTMPSQNKIMAGSRVIQVLIPLRSPTWGHDLTSLNRDCYAYLAGQHKIICYIIPSKKMRTNVKE